MTDPAIQQRAGRNMGPVGFNTPRVQTVDADLVPVVDGTFLELPAHSGSLLFALGVNTNVSDSVTLEVYLRNAAGDEFLIKSTTIVAGSATVPAQGVLVPSTNTWASQDGDTFVFKTDGAYSGGAYITYDHGVIEAVNLSVYDRTLLTTSLQDVLPQEPGYSRNVFTTLNNFGAVYGFVLFNIFNPDSVSHDISVYYRKDGVDYLFGVLTLAALAVAPANGSVPIGADVTLRMKIGEAVIDSAPYAQGCAILYDLS